MLTKKNTRDKSYLENIQELDRREKIVLASGKAYSLICDSSVAISAVEIAMSLNVRVPTLMQALYALSDDCLIEKNEKGDWQAVLVEVEDE
ncbi:MAG: hypothetical protein AAGD96_28240 [Chloroflexota bacterium]